MPAFLADWLISKQFSCLEGYWHGASIETWPALCWGASTPVSGLLNVLYYKHFYHAGIPAQGWHAGTGLALLHTNCS